jgi:hypothetical protein
MAFLAEVQYRFVVRKLISFRATVACVLQRTSHQQCSLSRNTAQGVAQCLREAVLFTLRPLAELQFSACDVQELSVLVCRLFP